MPTTRNDVIENNSVLAKNSLIIVTRPMGTILK